MDIEELRQRLLDYYGTAVNSGIENARSELNGLDEMSDDEIIALAEENVLEKLGEET